MFMANGALSYGLLPNQLYGANIQLKIQKLRQNCQILVIIDYGRRREMTCVNAHAYM